VWGCRGVWHTPVEGGSDYPQVQPDFERDPICKATESNVQLNTFGTVRDSIQRLFRAKSLLLLQFSRCSTVPRS
jgi:hypothetical protein